MRPKGVIAVLFILLLLTGFLYFFADRLLEHGMESAGESVIGAKVEIDNLKFSLADLSISWDRLQVANPNDTWRNLVATSRFSFDMEAASLIRKKLVINDVTATDIRIGSQRKTDGKIDRPEGAPPGLVQQATESLGRQLGQAPILNLGALKRKVNVDSLMQTFDIQTLHRLQEAKTQTDSTFRQWRNRITTFDPKGDLQKVETDITTLQSQEVSGLQDLVAAADKSKRILSTLNRIKTKLDSNRTMVSKGIASATTRFANVDNWIDHDFEAVKAKANLGDLSPKNVGKMLFGEVVVQPTVQTLEYVALIRKYMPVAQQLLSAGKVEKPPRLKGQDIRFPLLNGKPDFLLEHLLLSGSGNRQVGEEPAFLLNGQIDGITSEQKIYGKPLTFALNALLPGSNTYEISGEIDHVGDIPVDRFSIKALGVKLRSLSLPDRPYLPSTVWAERGDVGATFALTGSQLNARFNFRATPVRFEFTKNDRRDDAISRITQSVFDSIETLSFSAAIVGPLDDLDLQISSNVDDILANKISALAGESVKQAGVEIRRRIESAVGPKRQEAEAFVKQGRGQIMNKLNAYQEQVDEKLAIVDAKKKEIEGKITAKKKEGLDDVKGKLKGLFKKK